MVLKLIKTSRFLPLSEYETTHLDTVTSMVILNKILITGSKDKSTRKWDMKSDE